MGGRGGGGMGGRGGGGFARGGGVSRGPGVARGGSFAPAPGFGRAPVMRPGFVSGRPVGVRTVSPSGRVIVTTRPFGHPFFGHPFFGHTRPFFHGCFGGFPCNNGFFFGNPFFFGAGFGTGFGLGFGLGFPFFPSYSYIPGFDSQYYAPPPQQPVAAPETNANDVQMAMQMQRLSDEVEYLREEQTRQTNAPRAAAPSPSAQQPAAPTTFVFRDGHQVATKNYAIADHTLWILTEHTARRFSLADLDVAATEKTNAANGIELHLPEVSPR
jgi:hypothetical protein